MLFVLSMKLCMVITTFELYKCILVMATVTYYEDYWRGVGFFFWGGGGI